MPRVYASHELEWNGDRLMAHHAGGVRSVAVIPDANWLGMWRVRRPDGTLTDMLNRARVRDAARSILLAGLNGQETVSGGRQLRFVDRASPKTMGHIYQQASFLWAGEIRVFSWMTAQETSVTDTISPIARL